MGASSTATLIQSSSNTLPSSISSREANERFNIDKGKCNCLLSCGFAARTIERQGLILIGERLHYNTVHNLMKRNGMTRVKESYIDLSDQKLLELIRNISNSFHNSGSKDMFAYLRKEIQQF